MLAYAYKATIETEVETFSEGGKKKTELIPRLPDEAKNKLAQLVSDEWPNKDVNVRVKSSLWHAITFQYPFIYWS